MEKDSGFRTTTQRKLTSKLPGNQIQPDIQKPTKTPLDLSLDSQRIFRSIGKEFHGSFLSASRLAVLLGFTFCLLICVSLTSKFVYFQPFCIFISLFENLKDLIFCHNDAFCQILSSCVAIYCLGKH